MGDFQRVAVIMVFLAMFIAVMLNWRVFMWMATLAALAAAVINLVRQWL